MKGMACSSFNTQVGYCFIALFPCLWNLSSATTTYVRIMRSWDMIVWNCCLLNGVSLALRLFRYVVASSTCGYTSRNASYRESYTSSPARKGKHSVNLTDFTNLVSFLMPRIICLITPVPSWFNVSRKKLNFWKIFIPLHRAVMLRPFWQIMDRQI